MSKRLKYVLATCALVVCGGPTRTQQPVTHALLIGVTNYPALEARFRLTGPSNDVELVRQTLLGEPFRVADGRIRVLTEAPGAKPSPAAREGRPTKANIAREFTRLADPKVINPGDQVFILFAGHGSQQPDTSGDEDDGWDEIFLPADAGKWTGEKGGGVVNAIPDDEIAEWLTAIRKRGAFVSVVFDACQSTSMTRGNDVEAQRLVPPGALGIPAGAVTKTSSRGALGDAGVLGLGPEAGDIAALYAAQTIEPTPEKELPSDSSAKNAKVHGLFTYTLVSVLSQARGRLTYRDLGERVIQQYKAMGRIGPTPGFEGGGLDREVLGQKNFAGASRIVVGEKTESGAGVLVRAGEIHGLTNGSILRVFAATPPNDKPVGHAKLASVSATSAVAEPHAFAGLPAPDVKLLTAGSRAEVAFYEYGEDVFKVALHAPDKAPPADVAKAVQDALSGLAKETDGRAAPAASVSDANWLVRVTDASDVVVAPASGWRVDPSRKEDDTAQAPFLVGRADSGLLARELARVLLSVARVRNLLRIGVAPESQGGGDVAVELELLRFKDKSDTTGTVVTSEHGERILRIGDSVAFRVKNTGVTAADVTLLFIDADYGITTIFPRPGAETDARVPVAADRRTIRLPVSAPTGPEQILAIAVAGTGARQDFRGLEQPPLHRAATRSGGSEQQRAISDSPLGRLLKGVVNGQGATRGIGDGELGPYSMKMVTWRTVRAGSQ